MTPTVNIRSKVKYVCKVKLLSLTNYLLPKRMHKQTVHHGLVILHFYGTTAILLEYSLALHIVKEIYLHGC